MSWRHAPLYIEAHDLAAWIVGRTATWQEDGGECLAPRIASAACDLLDAVALALTFPSRRAHHLERADEAIVVLRTELRLAKQLGLLAARPLRFASDRSRAIGRMIGGWRKKVEASARRRSGSWKEQVSGDEPPAARSA